MGEDVAPTLIRQYAAGHVGNTQDKLNVITYKKTGHAKSKDDGQGWTETEVTETLNTFDQGETRTPTLVCAVESHAQDARYKLTDVNQPLSANMENDAANGGLVYENHGQDCRYRQMGDVCQTVSATYGMGGNNQPLVIRGGWRSARRRGMHWKRTA